MKLNFRQGIQHSPMVSGHPSFLTYNTSNDTITVSVGTDLVRATAAWRNVNYLIEERETLTSAWGPFPLSTTYYLYWDINIATGKMTRGITSLHPEIGLVAPSNPGVGLHWYDTAIDVMKAWDGVQWAQKVRVFAATYVGGSHVITEYDLGTQVGIFTPTDHLFEHGYILYGIDQKAIKNSDGSMVTTAVPLNTYHGTFSSPIRLELANSTMLASEPIAAFSAVSSNGLGSIQLASGVDVEKRPIGIVTGPANTGDAIDIVFKGIVYNDQWNWNATLGKDLYCGPTGILFQGFGSFVGTRVGVILDTNTALIDVDLFGASSGGSGEPGISWPLLAPTEFNFDNPVIPFSFEDSPATGAQLVKAVEIEFDPFIWVATFGDQGASGEFNASTAAGQSIAYDSVGNLYVIGNGGDGTEQSDASVLDKRTPNGDIVWTKMFTRESGLDMLNIAIDSSDSIYVCGTSQIDDYNGYKTIASVIKLSSVNGSVIWKTDIDNSDSEEQSCSAICVASDGNVYVTVEKYSPGNSGYYDSALVVKLSPSGVKIWSKQLVGAPVVSSFNGNAINGDASGNVYVTGHAKQDNVYHATIVKLNSVGDILWFNARKDGTSSSYSEYFNSRVDSLGNVYAVGTCLSNSFVSMISKYDSSGTLVWELTSNSTKLHGIAVDSTGIYVSGADTTSNDSQISVQKLSFAGVMQWSRALKAGFNDIEEYYDKGSNTIAVHNGYFAITGYSSIPGFSQPQELTAQFKTDGSRIDLFGEFDYSGDTDTISWISTTPVYTATTLVSAISNVALQMQDVSIVQQVTQINVNTITLRQVKFPIAPAAAGDSLLFSREGTASLSLVSIEGGEVVKVTSDDLGLLITPGAGTAETHQSQFDKDSLTGVIRSIDGRIQTKLELNIGNDSELKALGGGTGFQSITPYQTSIWGPDLNVGEWNTDPKIDFSVSNSIVFHQDPLEDTGRLIPTGGLAGNQYEFIYKFANPNPGMTAFYEYAQEHYNDGFIGHIIVSISEGLAEVCVYSPMSLNVTRAKLSTGRGREVFISNNGRTEYNQASGDTAFISTTGNKIEMLTTYDGVCRMYGTRNAESLTLSNSSNGPNKMDGYMWMNRNTNFLYAVGLDGDIWSIDSTTLNPVEDDHITLPVGSRVISVDGSTIDDGYSLTNLLYVLYMLNGNLVLATIDTDDMTVYNFQVATSFVDVANHILVDDENNQVIVSSSNGSTFKYAVIDTTTLTLIGSVANLTVPLQTAEAISDVRKSKGDINGNNAVFPHLTDLIWVDRTDFTSNVISYTQPGIKLDRVLNDPRTNKLVCTATNNKRSEFGKNTTGVVAINTNGTLYSLYNPRSLSYTSIGYCTVNPNRTVGNYYDLDGNDGPGTIILATDTGIFWMATDDYSYVSMNEFICFSEAGGGYSRDHDCLTFMEPGGLYPTAYNVDVTPELVNDNIDSYNIEFPLNGIHVVDYFGNDNYLTQLPRLEGFNQVYIAKLSKVALFDDNRHDQSFKWYCTGISGGYNEPYPEPSSGGGNEVS